MRDEAHKGNCDASWWLKMDGCDLVEGLGESVDQVWTGDMDLADSVLQEQQRHYLDRLKFVSNLPGPADCVAGEVAMCEQQFADDCSFLTTSKFIHYAEVSIYIWFSPQEQERTVLH